MRQRYLNLGRVVLICMLAMILMGVNDCSQQANVTMRHIGNFFSYPVRALIELANGTNESSIEERYQAYVNAANARTAAANATPIPTPINGSGSGSNCEGGIPGTDPAAALESLNAQVIALSCACSPWDIPVASCENGHACCNVNICPREVQCPKICPQDIGMLRNNKVKAPPVTADGNYFSFLNSAFDVFPNEVRPLDRDAITNSVPSPGYNLGMISARRKFNEMASFNTGPVPNFHGDEAEKKRYYREKIDKIFDNQPAAIPGYRNLAEFSADPLVQRYLKQKIAAEWEDRAVGNDPFSEKKVDPKNVMTAESAQSMLGDVKKGISEMGSATVAFGFKTTSDEKVSPQALEAYNTFKDANNNDVICVHDPNLPAYPVNLGPSSGTAPSLHFPFADPPKACFPSVVIKPSGETTYLAKVRSYFDPPRVVRDDDGIETTVRYEDAMLDRPLYGVHHFKQADHRSAVLSIPRLAQTCLRERGCSDAN
ncbi:MAG: hypothetical protein A2X86_10165 [Bdellovibrionales bacterium GWA2_49_15]|nr:MAG: hypothetical protein A2X86_10165 [Bdellovibrionales bacterium GWA2_49_15]HAZ13749.1 hypothetical protein [Bdellovibrionales bacterium]